MLKLKVKWVKEKIFMDKKLTNEKNNTIRIDVLTLEAGFTQFMTEKGSFFLSLKGILPILLQRSIAS